MKRDTGFYTERLVPAHIVREAISADVTGYRQRAGWQTCKPLSAMTAKEREKYLDGHLKRWKDHAGLLDSERETETREIDPRTGLFLGDPRLQTEEVAA